MITDVAGKDLWVEVDGDGPLTGQSPFSAVAVGYKLELDAGVEGLKEMHSRGIRVLPGGDYGFAWTPHGTNARDLSHFVEFLGISPMVAIRAATVFGGEIMEDPTLGKVERASRPICCWSMVIH